MKKSEVEALAQHLLVLRRSAYHSTLMEGQRFLKLIRRYRGPGAYKRKARESLKARLPEGSIVQPSTDGLGYSKLTILIPYDAEGEETENE